LGLFEWRASGDKNDVTENSVIRVVMTTIASVKAQVKVARRLLLEPWWWKIPEMFARQTSQE
jgi:hypothetical protein